MPDLWKGSKRLPGIDLFKSKASYWVSQIILQRPYFQEHNLLLNLGLVFSVKSDRIYLVGNAAVYSQDKVNRLQGSDIEANSVKDKKCPKSAKIAERGSQTLCCHLRQIEFRQRQLQPRSKDKYNIDPKTNII